MAPSDGVHICGRADRPSRGILRVSRFRVVALFRVFHVKSFFNSYLIAISTTQSLLSRSFTKGELLRLYRAHPKP